MLCECQWSPLVFDTRRLSTWSTVLIKSLVNHSPASASWSISAGSMLSIGFSCKVYWRAVKIVWIQRGLWMFEAQRKCLFLENLCKCFFSKQSKHTSWASAGEVVWFVSCVSCFHGVYLRRMVLTVICRKRRGEERECGLLSTDCRCITMVHSSLK